MGDPLIAPVLFAATEGRTNGVFTSQLKYLIQVPLSATLTDMLPVQAAAYHGENLPVEGNVHPIVGLASCRGVTCEKTDDNGVYIYTADYSDEGSSDSEKQTDDNPLNDKPIIKPVAGMTSRAITRDRDGNAILNSAGDPIIQSMDDNTIGFKITANVASIPNWILNLRNTCNDAPLTVGGLAIATNAARFIIPDDWLSEQKNRNNIYYYEFTFELQLDEYDKHYGYPLNAGYRTFAFDEDFEKFPVAIVNKDGSEPSDPVPLDEEGEVLEDPQPDTVLYLEVKKYPEADYSVLPGVS